ncbi:AMP phosphorylase [Methanohalophilus portucalensis]|uniref:AMP phosphorylase n=2 Tax=Methanohalophilus portucalensis TaxID=39664 RepID=A0A1L9C470_9EURY|nr:AMP phosphorylase [Methanohalophilus portucalensis]ATU07903.1 AMP phosphorylase [Methanohalophilus portucalensis]OJH49263.1 AMP phosphorylase [Methanohalophilus portucalensis FDF-1]RNI11619.1 AMP phosphorylase [Methanohalophilus portucalensis FDF-1]SMH42079.1 AMP phosphorylase [Methanohalophilus portucalensis FDF-1]
MELKVQPIDIKVGKYKIILNSIDAKELGVYEGDRVRVTGHVTVTAIVDFTEDMISPGMIGLYHEVKEQLQREWTEIVEVEPAEKPKSARLIRKNMDGEKLVQEEIYGLVKDIVEENLSEIELAAFLTSTYINDMTDDETEWLTRAMIDTGEKLEFAKGPIMDKHSIGGVPGNKISLLVVPIVAANGLLIPKTSSRAITGAGGTSDLMEILAPVEFSASQVKEMTEKVGGVLVWGGATNIAPADDKLIKVEYPLSIDPHCQLLASIMAKKGAVGAENVVIDIPTGPGTKIVNVQEGRKLARDLINLGDRLGMNVDCALTYGASPIGRTVGPALEVREALKVLETGEGPNSLIEKSMVLAGMLLEMGGVAARGQGNELAMETLKNGKALAKFREIIEVQGGNPDVTYKDIIAGEHTAEITAPANGYVLEFKNKRVVQIARLAGAPNDKGAGVLIHKKQGEPVKKGEPVLTIHAEKKNKLETALQNAQRDSPIVVEGMLLERVQSFKEV